MIRLVREFCKTVCKYRLNCDTCYLKYNKTSKFNYHEIKSDTTIMLRLSTYNKYPYSLNFPDDDKRPFYEIEEVTLMTSSIYDYSTITLFKLYDSLVLLDYTDIDLFFLKKKPFESFCKKQCIFNVCDNCPLKNI